MTNALIEELFPENWTLATISELISSNGIFVDGDWIESKDQDLNGEVRLIQLADIGDGYFKDKSARFLTFEKAEELGCTFLNQNDILIARMPDPLGRACIFPLAGERRYVTAVDICIVRLGDNSIDPKYLTYIINSPDSRKEIENYQTGSTRKRISRSNLARIRFPIPPLAEQRRIVSKIEELYSEIDKGVEYLKTAQEQLKVYRQSVLKAAFEGRLTEEWREAHTDQLETADQLVERIQQERENLYQQQLNEWEEAVKAWEDNGKEGKKPSKPPMPKDILLPTEEELAELPNLPDGWCWVKPEEVSSPEKYSIGIGPFGSNLKVSDYRESGVPLIFVRNITNNNFDLDLKYISEEKLVELQPHIVQPLDIVITKMGDPPGDVSIYPQNRPVAVLTADCLKFRVWSDFVETKYFKYCIESNLVKKQLGVITKGVAQKKISTERFKTINLPLPGRTEQRGIVEELERKLSSADELQSEIDKALARSGILRQSILKKAFSGRLVAQDPNDEPASSLLERIRAERLAAPKPTRKPSTSKKKPRKKEVVDLISVLQSANDWLSAQDAFRECGVSDGAETEVIEKLFLELRDLEKEDRIEVERRGDEDWLRIRSTARS